MGKTTDAAALEEAAQQEVDVKKEIDVPPSRARTVVGLKLSGLNFTQIAEVEELTNASVARQIFENAIAGSIDEKDIAQARVLANMRLERLLQSVWGRSVDNKHPEHLNYLRSAMSILDRQIRLGGLDAPTKVEVSAPDAAEKEAYVRSLIERGAGPDFTREQEDIIDAEVVGDDE